jgi:hypothetical protein
MEPNIAFRGHGVFVERSPIETLRRYAAYPKRAAARSVSDLVDRFIEALHDMHMTSVWVQLFNINGIIDKDGQQGTKELVDGARAAGISIVPWGYCFGLNSEDSKSNDFQLAITLCNQYALEVFVADIEPGNKIGKRYDNWDQSVLERLATNLSGHFGTPNIGLSSFGSLTKQPTARRQLAPIATYFCFCAPQIYWGKREPVKYAQRCLDSWSKAVPGAAIVATTQSYWDKGENTGSQTFMETQLARFTGKFPDSSWSRLLGLNWYHAGGQNVASHGAMSQRMIATIMAARLDLKPYAP